MRYVVVIDAESVTERAGSGVGGAARGRVGLEGGGGEGAVRGVVGAYYPAL
jgi:hypothetical protein